ncbi:MAG: hypothetical protein Q4C41_06215 [Eggerthellaceae bacterium]|nr:hypothetical protein [Eggerthellaceae bacterium]
MSRDDADNGAALSASAEAGVAVQPAAASAESSVQAAQPAVDPEPVTFAAAMDTAKQKSKRRIPMVVLVALALALATGVAYAAYRVYTDIYLPSQQAQVEQQEPVAEEPELETNPEYEAAMQAYEGILDDYRGALSAENIAQYPDSFSVPEEVRSQYPCVSGMHEWSHYVQENTSYAFVDLNGDSIPELLLSDGGNSVFDIWSFDGTNPVVVAEGWDRNTYALCEGGIVFNHGSGGAYAGGNSYSVFTGANLKDSDSYDPNRPYADLTSNWKEVEGISWDGTAESDLVGTHVMPDGTTETLYGEDIWAKSDQLQQDYPEATDVDWIPLSS